jgi:hypothetical protein
MIPATEGRVRSNKHRALRRLRKAMVPIIVALHATLGTSLPLLDDVRTRALFLIKTSQAFASRSRIYSPQDVEFNGARCLLIFRVF